MQNKFGGKWIPGLYRKPAIELEVKNYLFFQFFLTGAPALFQSVWLLSIPYSVEEFVLKQTSIHTSFGFSPALSERIPPVPESSAWVPFNSCLCDL